MAGRSTLEMTPGTGSAFAPTAVSAIDLLLSNMTIG